MLSSQGSFIPGCLLTNTVAISSAHAQPEFTNGSTSVGIVCELGQFGFIIQVQRIGGELFESKEEAEQYGLDMCKKWIDKQNKEKQEMKNRAAIG